MQQFQPQLYLIGYEYRTGIAKAGAAQSPKRWLGWIQRLRHARTSYHAIAASSIRAA